MFTPPGTDSANDHVQEILGPEAHRAYANYADGTAAFNQIDSDRNGFISPYELRQYIQSMSERTNLSRQEQDKLRAAQDILENIMLGPEGFGVSRRDLEQNFLRIVRASQQQILVNLDRRARSSPHGSVETSEAGERCIFTDIGGSLSRQHATGKPVFTLTLRDQRRGLATRVSQIGDTDSINVQVLWTARQ